MAGKRQATSNLNHDNWDQDEEPEERGTFQTASPDELKTRVIKKATRRKAIAGASDAADGVSTSVFSGFSGFGKPATAAASSSAAASPFAFLSKLPVPNTTTTATTAISPPPAKKPFTFDTNLRNESTSNILPSSTIGRGMPSGNTSIFGNATKSPKPATPMFKSGVSVDSPLNPNATTEFRDSVADLNMAVMKFLQEHMDKNPYCILSPVFKGYETHLNELRDQNDIRVNEIKNLTKTSSPTTKATTAATTTAAAKTTITTAAVSTPTPAVTFSFGKPTDNTSATSSSGFGKKPNCTVTSGGATTAITAPIFSFGNVEKSSSKSETVTSTTPATSIFSFGVKPTASSTTTSTTEESPKPSFFSFGVKAATDTDTAAATAASPPKTNGFSFGLKSDDKPSTSGFTGFGNVASGKVTSGFSFASTTVPFSFGNVKPPTEAAIAAAAAEANAEDEEDKPPKVEFKQVVEEDASFSKRCKVFVKKDKDFADRGVGTLYLKPVKDSKKTQLLVRADTNLGNILINILLSEGVPCERKGKNNILMVCIPTPEEKEAKSILLRVKTGEEADELLEQIQKHIA